MMNKLLLILISLLMLSCHKNELAEYSFIDSDAHFLEEVISEIDSISKINYLINLGLYNLAFESVNRNNQKFNGDDYLAIAKRFVANGEYDKGLSIISLLDAKIYEYDILHLKLTCALSKQDNTLALSYLNKMLEIFGNTNNPIRKVELNLLQAYYAHNTKNYPLSISLNKDALNKIVSQNLPSDYLSMAFRRIGNNYNDIVRDNIPYPEERETCYSKALSYYLNELNILKKDSSANHSRIALNYITRAMVERAFKPNGNYFSYYEKALKELIIANDSIALFTRNPIYTSIALTHYGSLYFLINQKMQMDSFFDLNKKLIDTRSYYKVNDRQSLDVLEYFPQRSQEVKILYHLKYKCNTLNPLELLNLSNSSKYSNQQLAKYLQENFGTNSAKAVNNWILLNELKILAKTKNDISLYHLTNKHLLRYNDIFTKFNKNKVNVLTEKNILELKTYCKTNNTSILDYQVLYDGSMLILRIDKSNFKYEWIESHSAVNKKTLDSLIDGMSNNLPLYNKLSFEVSQKLRLNDIKTKNIILCPDEYLEGISFESLLTQSSSSKNWLNNDYIGNNHRISLIPNFNTLLNHSQSAESLIVDVWTSDVDNNTLPYNKQLIDFLKNTYSAQINHSEPGNILHILAHTYQTNQNNIEFRLDKDTLTVYSNNQIKPSLAILEGCESGKGNIYKFEGSISQTRCFLYNGTPSVIYSLWDADNQSSNYLFQQFYKYLDDGLSTNQALFRAKRDTRNNVYHPEWANPYYWANFQLTGKDLVFTQ